MIEIVLLIYRTAHQIPALPIVFLLGNHSSGKSSFINYVTGQLDAAFKGIICRKLQHTGVAPTDDSFTVIVAGKENATKDGSTLVDDPGLGFEGLKRFGLPFLSHLSLKIRNHINSPKLVLIDSPGMIDNPSMSNGSQ